MYLSLDLFFLYVFFLIFVLLVGAFYDIIWEIRWRICSWMLVGGLAYMWRKYPSRIEIEGIFRSAVHQRLPFGLK